MASRANVRRTFRWAFAGVIFALALGYAADSLFFHFRADKYATVKVTPYYAVPRKDKKIEYMFDDPSDQTCVNSLFPRDGDTPCWYLRKHKEKRIDL